MSEIAIHALPILHALYLPSRPCAYHGTRLISKLSPTVS